MSKISIKKVLYNITFTMQWELIKISNFIFLCRSGCEILINDDGENWNCINLMVLLFCINNTDEHSKSNAV